VAWIGDRRRYPRIAAAVFYRPAGPPFLHHRRSAIDVSAGGMRVYSDDRMSVGARLEIELLLDDESSARCWARVAWIEHLPPGAGAAYDIGLEFTDMTEVDRQLLAEALKRSTA
jgi:c-di-GMP-binding flagellar brake protein YcgR